MGSIKMNFDEIEKIGAELWKEIFLFKLKSNDNRAAARASCDEREKIDSDPFIEQADYVVRQFFSRFGKNTNALEEMKKQGRHLQDDLETLRKGMV